MQMTWVSYNIDEIHVSMMTIQKVINKQCRKNVISKLLNEISITGIILKLEDLIITDGNAHVLISCMFNDKYI